MCLTASRKQHALPPVTKTHQLGFVTAVTWTHSQQRNCPTPARSSVCFSWRERSTGISELSGPVRVLGVCLETWNSFVLQKKNLYLVSTVHQPLARLQGCSHEEEEPNPHSSGSLHSRKQRRTKTTGHRYITLIHRCNMSGVRAQVLMGDGCHLK